VGTSGVGPDATVYDAITFMMEKRVGALLVVAHGVLAGIIPERDYARKGDPAGQIFEGHSCPGNHDAMTEHRVRHLPVLEGTIIVGVVSIGDLVKAIISEQANTIPPS
jgi:CBS domain-containing protein